MAEKQQCSQQRERELTLFWQPSSSLVGQFRCDFARQEQFVLSRPVPSLLRSLGQRELAWKGGWHSSVIEYILV